MSISPKLPVMLPNSLLPAPPLPVDRHSDQSEAAPHDGTDHARMHNPSPSPTRPTTATRRHRRPSSANPRGGDPDSQAKTAAAHGLDEQSDGELFPGSSGSRSDAHSSSGSRSDAHSSSGSDAGSERASPHTDTSFGSADSPTADPSPDDQGRSSLELMHGLDGLQASGLPFGLQVANSAGLGLDIHATHDAGMSDDDDEAGGVLLHGSSLGNVQQMAAIVQDAQLEHNGNLPTDPGLAMEYSSQLSGTPDPSWQSSSWGHNDGTIMSAPGIAFGLAGAGSATMSPPAFLEPDPIPPTPLAAPYILPAAPVDEDLPPLMPSSTNSAILGSENLGLVDFLRFWGQQRSPPHLRAPLPDLDQVLVQANQRVGQVGYADLNGDQCDFQGLSWAGMGTTRNAARERRFATYKNYVNRLGSDHWNPRRTDIWLPQTDSYFRFRKMTMRSDVSLAHFQLRNVLACPSRSQVYYASTKGINRLNPLSRKTDLAWGFGGFPDFGRTITALDANRDVLVGGTFKGEFVIKPLHTDDKKACSEGLITDGVLGITNHLQVHTPRRSSSPVAAFSSNDWAFRVLDIQTEQFVSDFLYQFPLNCSAISPDRRLRVLVGDTQAVTITNAETGETEVELSGHRDYGFSCAWSEDGRTVATGSQDKSIKIWDCRKWTDSRGVGMPVASIWCEMAGARSLRFSPLGSGEPVLVAAEEADYVNVINATTFESKQTFDLFGEIGGVAFSDEGRELDVLVSDSHRGGLVQLERCGPSRGVGRPSMIERIPPF